MSKERTTADELEDVRLWILAKRAEHRTNHEEFEATKNFKHLVNNIQISELICTAEKWLCDQRVKHQLEKSI